MMKDYARHLQHDAHYADKAAKVVAHIQDVGEFLAPLAAQLKARIKRAPGRAAFHPPRSEEHTSELQSLMRISYAVFCLNRKKTYKNIDTKREKQITQ